MRAMMIAMLGVAHGARVPVVAVAGKGLTSKTGILEPAPRTPPPRQSACAQPAIGRVLDPAICPPLGRDCARLIRDAFGRSHRQQDRGEFGFAIKRSVVNAVLLPEVMTDCRTRWGGAVS